MHYRLIYLDNKLRTIHHIRHTFWSWHMGISCCTQQHMPTHTVTTFEPKTESLNDQTTPNIAQYAHIRDG